MRFPFAIFLAAAVACGDSASGPDTANVAGTWRFSYTNMSGVVQGVAVSCNAAALDFTLSQAGNSFSGAQVGVGRMLCFAQGQTVVDELIGAETLVGGTINGSNVSFRLGTIAGQHTGTVSGGSMTGTATWTVSGGSVNVTLNGQFAAVRL